MRRYTKGITLIEMIIILAVLGLAIPTLMLMWQNLAYHAGRSEVIAQATFYAQGLMEEIKSKDFEDPDQSPDFGPESGEGGRSDYDDVDDFVDYSDNPPTGYTRTVTVVYLDPTISDGGTWQVLSPGESDFKQVTVSIFHQFIADSDLVTTIVSRH